MQVGDFAKEYQSKTDEELLRLAKDSDQLTSEARSYLDSELVRRGIDRDRVRGYLEQRGLPVISVLDQPHEISAAPIVSGNEQYVIGPVLAAQRPKPPWRPRAAGRIAFFFGPVAGALIASISLRRMGFLDRSKKALRISFGIAVGEGVILFFLPNGFTGIFGLVTEIIFLLTFPKLMEHEFAEWQSVHPDVIPSSGWNAIGWGILGSLLFIVVAVAVMTILAVVLGLLRILIR